MADENNISKVIIIGSGPAGLTAALYTARAELKPKVIAGVTWGGQLMNTTEVENFPGFPHGILGPELMQNFLDQAQRFGAEIIFDNVTKVDFSGKPFKVWTGDSEHVAETMIIATGASWRHLGLPSEDKFLGKGISFCATCDGFFFKDKQVIVIGGGDAAMEEANYLTKFAKTIAVLNRSDELKASVIMQEKVKANPKVTIEYNKEVTEFLGEGKLEGVKVKDNESGEVVERKIDGVFVAVGHKPNSDLFTGQLEVDEKGFIKVTDQTKTSVEGVFVAGDVKDYRYRQAVTAAGMGCMAAMDVEKFLSEKN